jgi:hypothetical protein
LAWTYIPFKELNFNKLEWFESEIKNSSHNDQPTIKIYCSKKDQNIVQLTDINGKDWKIVFNYNVKFYELNNIFYYDSDTTKELKD